MKLKSDLLGATISGPHTLIIGDLHLSPSRPDITNAFAQFLNLCQHNTDALYIVGDLFESWIGDDDNSDFNTHVIDLLRRTSQKTRLYFCHGNRDFLIGERFIQQTGAELLAEEEIVDLYDKRTVILHGDSLCTDDTEYQRFRRLRSKPWFQKLLLALPLKLRRQIAQRARAKSLQTNYTKPANIMDVTRIAVEQTLTRNQACQIIHGHTHKPAIHSLGQNRQRIVVGDWYEQGSVLIVSPAGARLCTFPLNRNRQ